MTRVSEVRVSQTVYEYTFRLDVKNGPAPVSAARVEITGAGVGTTVVDGISLVGDLGAGAQIVPADTVTLRHDRSVPFDPGSLKWAVTPAPVLFTTQVALADLGVVDVDYSDGRQRLYVPEGGTISRRLSLSLMASQSPDDLKFAIDSPLPTAYSIASGPSGIEISVSASGRAAGDILSGAIRITRISTRQHAVVPMAAEVLAIAERRTTVVSGGGGAVETSMGVIAFSANRLSGPQEVITTVTTLPTGDKQIDLDFGRDVSAEGITVRFPPPPLNDTPLDARAPGELVSSNASGKRPLATPRASPLSGPENAACTRVTDGKYITFNAPDGIGTSIGTLVLERTAYFVNGYRLSPTLNAASPSGARLQATLLPSSTLQAAVLASTECSIPNVNTLLERVDWEQYEPVVFVHGYQVGNALGGGKGTWEQFPSLAVQTTAGSNPSAPKKLLPFEFRWRTNADFKTAASDLGRAINYIKRRSGKPVHVVAHSFGGVLVRTLLQGMAPDIPDIVTGNMSDARIAVADLTSLGSPYSGIMPSDSGVDLPDFSVELPKGRDDGTTIGLCRQISCHQMGEATGEVAANAPLYGYTAAELKPGGLAAELAVGQDRLPPIPIGVGIGLRIDDGRYKNGDDLIRFAGQRFRNPRSEAAGNAADLLYNTSVGAATVSEVVLGGDRSARPQALAPEVFASRRPRGYIHTALVAADGGSTLGFGLEAAVQADCDIPETCSHAGYLLFKQMMGNALNLNNQAAALADSVAAFDLSINPAKLRSLNASQVAELQTLLASVRPYISGPRVRWDKVPAADLRRHNATLSRIFGDAQVTAVVGDYARRLESFNAFSTRMLESQNAFVILDAENVRSLLDVAQATAKGAYAAVKILEPGARLVNSVGAKVKFADPIKYAETLSTLRALSQHAELIALLGDCGSATLSQMELALRGPGPDSLDAGQLQETLLSVTNCLTKALSDDASDYSKTFKAVMKLAASSIEVDGRRGSALVALTDALSAVLDVMPPYPVVGVAQGVIDYANAFASSWAAGNAIADHTNEVISLRQDQVLVLVDQLRNSMLSDRSLQIIAARSADLFVATQAQWGTVQFSPDKPTAGEASSWSVINAYDAVASVVWRFGSAVVEIVEAVVNGVTRAVTYVFDSTGLTQVLTTFKDAAGAVLGVQTTTVDVQAAIGRVDRVAPLIAVIGQPQVFTVSGAALPAGLKFQLSGCEGVTEQPGGTAEQRAFTCTFPAGTPAGNFDGTIATSTSPFGAPPLRTFTVAARRAVVSSVSPARTTRTIATSFQINGEELPTSGLTVTPKDDSRASCQAPINMTPTGLGVACELYKVGAQVLEIRQGSAVLGSVTVNVDSNVSGVTWTSLSTANSGTVKFGETVTFKVAGMNLLADPVLGFAVERCGVSNTEVGTPTNTQRTFTCLFNNEAGATAGLKPGVVKDAPGGQVLFDGWSVPVEAPQVTGGQIFSDEFNGAALDIAKWTSVGFTYRNDYPNPPIGPVTVGGGIADFGAFGGISTSRKVHVSGQKIIVEARVARTRSGEFPIALHDTDSVSNYILISDTPYCGAGLAGGGGGAYEILENLPVCGGSSVGHSLNLGSPPAAGVWMEYRMTIDGNKLTIERGPTLQNITQRGTATLGRSIAGRTFYLVLRTGDNFYSGAQFDWIRVNAPVVDLNPGQSFWSDDFSGAALDASNWTVTPIDSRGVMASYSQSGGVLNVSVAGGSCGSCGVSDGARFTPRVDPINSDFDLQFSFTEGPRVSRDSARPVSTVQLLSTGANNELGVYVIGDALGNTGTPGHRIYTYYRIGGVVTFGPQRDLPLASPTSLEFRIRRNVGANYVGYRMAGETNWMELAVPTSFPNSDLLRPSVVVASGDGGGTRVNSSFAVSMDNVVLYRTYSNP